jgi:hypothetical protein
MLSNDWVSDFYVFHLVPVLADLGASEPEIGKLLRWFQQTAPKWVEDCSSAKDFATYARSRLRIKLGQTKNNAHSLAMKIIDVLFDDEDNITLQQVLDAVTMLVPAQPFPLKNRTNGDTKLVDLGDTLILKCDKQFFEEVLKPFYPFEGRGTKNYSLVKRIPMGLGAEREVNLFDLACWHRFPNATKAERKKCALHSADRLDWSRTNLYSRLEEGIWHDQHQERVGPLHDDTGVIPSVYKDSESQRDTPEAVAARKMQIVPHGTKHDQTVYLPEGSSGRVDWDFDKTPSDFGTEPA